MMLRPTCRTLAAGLACLPVFAGGATVAKTPDMIHIYDLTHTLGADLSDPQQAARVWDEAHAVATLQGLVNRRGPRLYLRYVVCDGRNVDDWWLEKLTGPGEWLAGAARRPVASLEELVTLFRDDVAGAVVYDPRVPATSNVASALAGAENLVAVRWDPAPGSVYDRLVERGPRLPVRRRLLAADGAPLFTGRGTLPGSAVPSSGSAKCDAYRWALRELIESGRCDPAVLAYYIDSYWIDHAPASVPNHHTLTNHDYFVARRAFFCDLSCWAEAPVDDPAQPPGTDLATLRAILHALHERRGGGLLHVGGFTPWAFKYTSFGRAGGQHDGVDTEWELVRIVSAFSGFLDADAIGYGAMANASFFMHYPLAERYPQAAAPAVPVPAAAADRDWVMFYVGDYDSAAWLYQRVPQLWEDPRRGSVPLSWAISPVLERRAPMALAHLWRTRSDCDAFIAADNGAGYLNPSMLTPPRAVSGLPGGLEDWTRHCRELYRRWDLRITGFIIDGHAPPMSPAVLDAYATFSPDGIVPQKTEREAFLHGDMPVLRSGPDITEDEPAAAARTMQRHVAARRAGGLRFHWFRSILRSPAWHAEAAAELRRLEPGVTIVTAPEFFARLREALRTAPR